MSNIDKNNLGKNLSRANLEYADLRGIDLKDADLQGANLYKADLTDANLEGFFLRPLSDFSPSLDLEKLWDYGSLSPWGDKWQELLPQVGEYRFYKYAPKNYKYIEVSNYDLFTTLEVYVNGIEDLEQIDSIYYVKYTIDSIISELGWSKIRIDEVINIAEFDSYFPEEKWELLRAKLESFLLTGSIEFNEKWVYLWCNFEGDLGCKAIFKRIKSEYILLWFNIWDWNKEEAIITNSLVKGEMKTYLDKIIQS